LLHEKGQQTQERCSTDAQLAAEDGTTDQSNHKIRFQYSQDYGSKAEFHDLCSRVYLQAERMRDLLL
jgi:hypothetical protein